MHSLWRRAGRRRPLNAVVAVVDPTHRRWFGLRGGAGGRHSAGLLRLNTGLGYPPPLRLELVRCSVLSEPRDRHNG